MAAAMRPDGPGDSDETRKLLAQLRVWLAKAANGARAKRAHASKTDGTNAKRTASYVSSSACSPSRAGID